MKTMTFRGPILMLALLGVVSGCTPHEEPQQPLEPPQESAEGGSLSDGVEPEPEPETVTVAVASVQLQDDCPEPPPEAKLDAPGESEDEGEILEPDLPPAEGKVDPSRAAEFAAKRQIQCVQSTVQLSIVSEDSKALPFSVRAVRLRRAEGGGSIETMKARTPKHWIRSAYSAWDESIPPGATLKVSYVLGAPDWAAVERALEESSYGPLYVVELEVEVAGRLQVITSPVAPRELEEDLVT